MVGIMRFLALLLACLTAFVAPVFAQEFETKAKFAVLMDAESGTILLNKNADERLEPASMSKLMTLAVVFTYLQQGIAIVLVFIGIKMLVTFFHIHIHIAISLSVIVVCIAGSIFLSMWKNKKEISS